MLAPKSGAADLREVIAATGLSLSPADVAHSTGSGIDEPFGYQPQRAVEVLADALSRVHSTQLPQLGGAPREPKFAGSVVSPQDLFDAATRGLEMLDGGQLPGSAAYSHMSRVELVEVLGQRVELVVDRSSRSVLNQGLPELDNLRFDQVELLGFADWSHACIADPHLDLAIACRGLLSAFGAVPVREFLDAYSATPVDPVRLDWFSLAVELVP